jgi:deazaflavin-dependent oxidoreductase (nitroreductase family)
MTDWNDTIIAEFRANDGVVGGPFEGSHLLLLSTTGAKSGESRIAPLMYFMEGDERMIAASKAGSPENPAWYHNILADPNVHVEAATDHGIEEYDAVASALPEPRRTERYTEIGEANPGFAAYQSGLERKIPLVVLTRK